MSDINPFEVAKRQDSFNGNIKEHID